MLVEFNGERAYYCNENNPFYSILYYFVISISLSRVSKRISKQHEKLLLSRFDQGTALVIGRRNMYAFPG